MGGWLWDDDPATHCYRYFWKWYPAHCSVLHVKWKDYEHIQDVKRTKIMLFGMFDADALDQKIGGSVNNLIPLARSWEYAPSLSITSGGFSGGSYDKTERAYKISRDWQEATELEFTMNASSSSPVYNPCFLIENWRSKVRLTIDGQPVESGPDFGQGIEETADGVSSVVVWVRRQSTSPISVVISEPMRGDFDVDCDVDGVDLAEFVSNWLARGTGYWPVEGDLNADNRVDSADFAIFALKWLDTCE
jgi:hypothetical protein